MRNEGRKPLKVSYSETILASYKQAMACSDSGANDVRWVNDEPRLAGDGFVSASFTAHGRRLMACLPIAR